MSRGLGPNIGDPEWQEAQVKKQKAKEYSTRLRGMNSKFGLLNAESKTKLD